MCKMHTCCVCYGHFAPVQTLETSHWSRQACSREPVTRDVTESPPRRVSLIRWSITGQHFHLVSYCDLLTLCIWVVWFRLNSRWWFWCRDRHLQRCWSYLGQQPLKHSATQSMQNFRGWGWCCWNRRGKATWRDKADPSSDTTQSPFLNVRTSTIPLSPSDLDTVQVSFAAVQALTFCFCVQ